MEEFIRDEYKRISSKELKFPLIDEAKRLRDVCKKENNMEYYFLCDALIVDVYLEHGSYEEATKLLDEDIHSIDKVLYKKLYLSLLDRILYVYINKKNYRLAYRYASEKYKFIDKTNVDAMNRWNLEMSYIYGYMNETNKAKECLNNILKDPSDEILPYALSNLTKIYVDSNELDKAEECLNKCIACTDDEEGKVYCDYLLARVCLLKKQNSEALLIFKQIFDNEDINLMTLPIVNEYLNLLYDLKRYDDMGLVISKIALFINACDDYYLQRDFTKLKIKYLVAIKSVNELSSLIDEYESIDKKINDSEKKIMAEANEVLMNEGISTSVDSLTNKVDKLNNLISSSVIGSNLRDLIMSYNRNLQTLMNYDESTFILFKRTANLSFMADDTIICMNFKKDRLYEKKVSFEAITKTIAEIVIEKNNSIAFDFNTTGLEIRNIFNNHLYVDDKLMYVNAIPVKYQDDIFACMVYASKENDITSKGDTVLFETATKILESSLSAVFLSENLDANMDVLNHIIDANNLGLVYVSNDKMYLSKGLKNILDIKKDFIDRSDYLNLINKADKKRYDSICDLSTKYKIEYKLNHKDKTLNVIEEMSPYIDKTNKLLFSFGTISLKSEDVKTLLDGEKELDLRIKELNDKAESVEFKYSIIRIRANIKEYLTVKEIFGVDPYYVDDSDFVIILENEVNQHTIDKLIKKQDFAFSVIKYPRDILNVNESFNLSKICLDSNVNYFTTDFYKEYLKKKNVNSIAKSQLESSLPLILRTYHSFEPVNSYEACFRFNGFENENIRSYLDSDIQYDYDMKLYQSLLNKNVNVNCFIALQNKVIRKILEDNMIPNNLNNNIKFLIYEKDASLKGLIDKLVNNNVKIIIDANILDDISAISFGTRKINGIYIGKNINDELRANAIKIANMFNLAIYSSGKLVDFYKNIYLTKEIHEIN